MLEGKRFLPETGMPILKIARRMVLLAVELPEPFFVPTMIEKSFTTLSMRLLTMIVPLCGLRPVIQKIGVLDECLVTSLERTVTNRFHHLLVILPDFFQ